MRTLVIATLCCMTTTACGDESSARRQPPVRPNIVHTALPDGFVAAVEKLQRSTQRDVCDSLLSSQQLEIAHALDKQAKNLKALPPPQGVYARPPVEMGPIYVVDEASRVPTGLLRHRVEDWSLLYSVYKLVENKPANALWQALQSMTHSVIFNDAQRLDGANVYLGLDSEPMLERIVAGLEACIANPQCTQPNFDAGTRSYVERGNRMYAQSWKQVSGSRAPREAMAVLLEQVRRDYKWRFGFEHNDDIVTTATGLLLPLDPGPFVAQRETLRAYIERVWTRPGLAVKVQWVSRTTHPQAYLFVAEDMPGGRDFVNRSDREIHLHPGTSPKAIAHEIGHVLGLGDTYFTTYDSDACAYVTSFADDDIMAFHETGSVTQAQWLAIALDYEVTLP